MRSLVPHFADGTVRRVRTGDTELAVETVGDGEPVLLVHGFPHTRIVWRDVAALLYANGFGVVAVDLRGLGDSGRPSTGYDAVTMAADLTAVLDHLAVERVHAVGIDLGVPSVFALAATASPRVASLTLIEATLGTLPGAEGFFARGAPWWFGFHQAPGGLAERVVEGAEDAYLGHFLRSGSRRGVPADMAEVIVDAYRGAESLRCGFEHYRAMPATARWIDEWADDNRLDMPVLTIGGDTVGDATARQVAPLAADLRSEILPQSGHIVCVDEPARTAALVADLARRTRT
jgi:pimeloyl-ACP methyl ester carboxylesterase